MATFAIPASWGHLTTRMQHASVFFDPATGVLDHAVLEANVVDDTGVARGRVRFTYNYLTGQLTAADGTGVLTLTAGQQTTASNGGNLFPTILDAGVNAYPQAIQPV